jgi:hypothetical protein
MPTVTNPVNVAHAIWHNQDITDVRLGGVVEDVVEALHIAIGTERYIVYVVGPLVENYNPRHTFALLLLVSARSTG